MEEKTELVESAPQVRISWALPPQVKIPPSTSDQPGCAPAHPGPGQSPGAHPSLRSCAVPLPMWPAAQRKSSRSPGRAATTWGTVCKNLRGGECQKRRLLPGGAGGGDWGVDPGGAGRDTEKRPRSKGELGGSGNPEAQGQSPRVPSPLLFPPPCPAHCFLVGQSPAPGTAHCGCSHGPCLLQPNSRSLQDQGSPDFSWGQGQE